MFLPKWHPAIASSEIEDGLPPDRIGCVRRFRLSSDGGLLREQLLSLADDSRCFTYSILESPIPVENYLAQLTLHPVTADDTTVGIWAAEFDVSNDNESGVVDAVGNGTFGTAFEVLNGYFASER